MTYFVLTGMLNLNFVLSKVCHHQKVALITFFVFLENNFQGQSCRSVLSVDWFDESKAVSS